jgi:hypothetical protein
MSLKRKATGPETVAILVDADQTNAELHDALRALPMRDRVTELIAAAVEDRNAMGAVLCLISISAVMARYLNTGDRAQVRQHMHEEAELIDALLQ